MNIDGYNVHSEYNSSLTHIWNTTLYSNGAHHIQIRSAVNSTFFRAIDYDVFVDNTPTVKVPANTKRDISAFTAIFFAVIGFVFFKSDLIESRKYKVVVVVASVSVWLVIVGYIWMFL